MSAAIIPPPQIRINTCADWIYTVNAVLKFAAVLGDGMPRVIESAIVQASNGQVHEAMERVLRAVETLDSKRGRAHEARGKRTPGMATERDAAMREEQSEAHNARA